MVLKVCLSSHSAVLLSQDFIKAEPADAMKTPVRQLVMTTCANLLYPSNRKNRITDNKASSTCFMNFCSISS